MKRLIAMALSLMLSGCCWVIPEYGHRSIGHIDKTPEVFISLSRQPQMCADADGKARLKVFIHLINMGQPRTHVELDGRYSFDDIASPFKINLTAGYGEHEVIVTPEGYHPVSSSFTVYRCDGF